MRVLNSDRFISFCVDLMMEQHDVLLSTYTSLHHIKALEEKITNEIALGRQNAEAKKRTEEELEDKARKEAEDGKYDALVEILRYEFPFLSPKNPF